MSARTSSVASTVVDGTGTFPASLNPRVVDETVELTGARPFIAQGCTELNRAGGSQRPTKPLPGVTPLYPSASDIEAVYGLLGGRLTHATRDSWWPVVQHMNDLRIAACDARGATYPAEVFGYSQPGAGHCEVGVERRIDLTQRSAGGTCLGVTIDPDEKYQLDALARFPWLPNLGQHEGWYDTSVEVDKRSPLYLRYGRQVFLRCIAKALAALIAGTWQFPEQKSVADATVALASESPRVGMSFGMKHLIPGPGVGWYRPLARQFGWVDHGRVNVKDGARQAKAAIEQALTGSDLRALDEGVDFDRQGFVTITMPWPLGKRQDVPAWKELMADVGHWLENTYRTFVPIWVAGAGVPLPGEERLSPHWCLATAFYPLPALPNTIQTLVETAKDRGAKAAAGVPDAEKLKTLWKEVVLAGPQNGTASATGSEPAAQASR